jgi:hypothetical protein
LALLHSGRLSLAETVHSLYSIDCRPMPPSRCSLTLLWLGYTTALVAPRSLPARATALHANAIDEDAISDFCKGTNAFWKSLIIPVVRDYADVKPKGTADVDDFFSVVTAAPETPGIPRPVWLTIAASVPTGLIWYGWYKYSASSRRRDSVFVSVTYEAHLVG